MKPAIELRLGCISDPIKDQLKEQGFSLVADDAGLFQRMSDSINELRVRGLLTTSESHKANTRLVKQIAKKVNYENN